MMMSLDGYAAGPEQSEENPFGIGGMQLNEWPIPLKAFREMHGEEGGEVNASAPIVETGSRTSARPSWAAICSEAARGRGARIRGWGSGERSRPTTPSSSSPTTRASGCTRPSAGSVAWTTTPEGRRLSATVRDTSMSPRSRRPPTEEER
jgi:hypothetical protein